MIAPPVRDRNVGEEPSLILSVLAPQRSFPARVRSALYEIQIVALCFLNRCVRLECGLIETLIKSRVHGDEGVPSNVVWKSYSGHSGQALRINRRVAVALGPICLGNRFVAVARTSREPLRKPPRRRPYQSESSRSSPNSKCSERY